MQLQSCENRASSSSSKKSLNYQMLFVFLQKILNLKEKRFRITLNTLNFFEGK